MLPSTISTKSPSSRRLRTRTRAGLALAGLAGATLLACSAAPSQPQPQEATASTSEAITGLPANAAWSGWSNASGGLSSNPSIVNVGVMHYLVAATGPNGTVWTNWYNGTSWVGWTNLGNFGANVTLAPTAVYEPFDGTIGVYVIDSSGTLIKKSGHITSPNSTTAPTWTSWVPINPPGSLTVAQNGPPTVVVSQPGNQVNVFVTLSDGSAGLAHGFSAFYQWSLLSGSNVQYEPGAVSWGPNRLDVFVSAANGLYHRYSDDNGTTWYPSGGYWEPLGGQVYTTPQVASWGPSRLDVFAGSIMGGQAAIRHLAYTGHGWGTCSAQPCWESLPGMIWGDGPQNIATPAVITLGPQQMEVFAQGLDKSLADYALTADESGNTPSQWSVGTVPGCFRTSGAPSVTTDNTGFAVAMTGYDPNNDGNVFVNRTGWGWSSTATPPTCQLGVVGATCSPSSINPEQRSCNTGEACVSGRCVLSGNAGEACNTNGSCNGQNVCSSGTCVACGASGEPHCASGANSGCNAGLVESGNGSCVPCGASGEPHCSSGANNGCNAGLYVDAHGTCQTEGPISFNWGISFPGNVAAGGSMALTMRPDGSYEFSGNMHDSGFIDYNYQVFCGIKDSVGNAYTLSKSGTIHGTESLAFGGSRDDSWDDANASSALANAWSGIETQQSRLGQPPIYCYANVNSDINTLFGEFNAAVGVAGLVISIAAY
jgi:hypothetical protein